MNAAPCQAPATPRDQAYAWWRGRAPNDSPNAEWIARILASWQSGLGAMPAFLGLEPDRFAALLRHHFGTASVPRMERTPRLADYSAMLEREDLTRLFLAHAAPGDPGERIGIAGILVAGCLGQDHLWEDLGLWSRPELSALIEFNFPALYAMNDRNMRWKKFFYKQLCAADGIHICRAPSCGQCPEFSDCFPTG